MSVAVGFEIANTTWDRLDEACRRVLRRRGHKPVEAESIVERLQCLRARMHLHFSIGADCPEDAAPHVLAAAKRLSHGVENLTLALFGELLEVEIELHHLRRRRDLANPALGTALAGG